MLDPSLTEVSRPSQSEQPMTHDPYYETMYILRPDIPEEEVESHLTKYRDMLVETGAEVLDSQMRGKRRLAYPINKHKEGIYVQLSHNGDGQQVAVLEKAKRLLSRRNNSRHRKHLREQPAERLCGPWASDSVRPWTLQMTSIRLPSRNGSPRSRTSTSAM